ncbi:aldehyde oxidase GLOX-like [Nicotiana tabacum]|uniref:Aldehyde oxidase GLOX n=2 Tax=Nicotiana TaxID=4085 RepID=A0A1S3XVU7_TOBAC|nr:PREDICTED: galactose oxidase-like [Nicotiana sylvestris]XP_016444066.1 PREDICTED: WSC domain-containing protein ARB_07867-like [Nicotiana tabacum]
MTTRTTGIPFLILGQLLLLLLQPCYRKLAYAVGGNWDLLISNIGISAMHMQLLNNDRVIMYDRTDFGASNISLPDGKCRNNPNDLALKLDCTAHSVEYDVSTNSVRPLMVQTDVWCSSGSATSDGSLVQTGGFNDGENVVRVFRPCNGNGSTCDWKEIGGGLIQSRWYATNHILPDGRQIIIGGREAFNYEFYPKTASTNSVFNLPFLQQTNDPREENNLYPFVFLNVDGNLFIFANDRAILFNYMANTVVKTYPQIPGGDPRNYPSTGSAVLLPLKNLQAQIIQAEVLVCGGTPRGSYLNASSGNFLGALNTCGRITITDPNPQWIMETMPLARTMGDMVILPNGNVLILNGAAAGTAGWELGRSPVLSPVIYRPDNPFDSRFEVQNSNTIPRMYHSTSILIRDGRVLVGGSNPHAFYNFTGVLYPTELSLETFSPSYLDPESANSRPRIIAPASRHKIKYGQRVNIRFTVPGSVNRDVVNVTMVAPGFNTHSFTMNQRMLVLFSGNVTRVGKSAYKINSVFPNSSNLAPAGYYLLFVVHQDIPSEGIWVRIQ